MNYVLWGCLFFIPYITAAQQSFNINALPRETQSYILQKSIEEAPSLRDGVQQLQTLSRVCKVFNDWIHQEQFLLQLSEYFKHKITSDEVEALKKIMNGPLFLIKESLLSSMVLLSLDKDSMYQLFKVGLLCAFVERGFTLLLLKSIKEWGILPNQYSKDATNPLMCAVLRSDCDQISLLLNQGAEIAKENCGKMSPLKLAMQQRNEKVVKLLLATSKAHGSKELSPRSAKTVSALKRLKLDQRESLVAFARERSTQEIVALLEQYQ